MRPRLIITNVGRDGAVLGEGFHVCVGGVREGRRWLGGRWRTFATAREWATDGLAWVREQLLKAGG